MNSAKCVLDTIIAIAILLLIWFSSAQNKNKLKAMVCHFYDECRWILDGDDGGGGGGGGNDGIVIIHIGYAYIVI